MPVPLDLPSACTSPPSSPVSVSDTRRLLAGVVLTRRAPHELEDYKDICELTIPPDHAELYTGEPSRILGEYVSGEEMFYYALLPDGLAYRFHSSEMEQEYAELIKSYEYKRNHRLLEPFDPSASYVHADSRIHLTITLDKARTTFVGKSLSEAELRYPEDVSSSSLTSAAAVSDSEYANSEEGAGQRTSKRGKLKIRLKLPFSPRKSRSRKVKAVVDSDGGTESGSEGLQPRRSVRTRMPTKASLAYNDDRTSSGSESSQGFQLRPRKPTKERKPERKVSLPAYGYVRDVSELAWDLDEDTAPLRAHRDECERCKSKPAHLALPKLRRKPKGPKRQKKKSEDDFEESEDEEERLLRLGGWMRCLTCPVVAHWGCLASTQRDEILRAILQRDTAAWHAKRVAIGDAEDVDMTEAPKKRRGLETNETSEFTCGSCSKGGACLGCLQPAPAANSSVEHPPSTALGDGDVEMSCVAGSSSVNTSNSEPQLLFRCSTCKRPAHYAHLPQTDDQSVVSTAIYHQSTTAWQCSDCFSFVYDLDKILAWRPWPADAKDSPSAKVPDYTAALPREYLVKWEDRGYGRTQWVPHMWLLATNKAKLKNFIMGGTKVALLDKPETDNEDNGQSGDVVLDDNKERRMKAVTWSAPLVDAERHIPRAWKTVDRVLDVRIFLSRSKQNVSKTKKQKTSRKRVESDSEDTEEGSEDERQKNDAHERGEQPSHEFLQTIEEWERRTKQKLSFHHADLVIWAFFKWDDLGYEEATWDAPPRRGERGFDAYERAFKRFLLARQIPKPKGPNEKIRAMDGYFKKHMLKEGVQPKLGQDPKWKLMDYQIDGFNWLCNNWWNLQHCILADEMGLGKTIQIVTFLGTVVKKWNAFPALIVVPNSTITNWLREFERWAPDICVVPFYGEVKARNRIAKYELAHFHVLVTTYEAIINAKDFSAVFKKQPRWEVLVVDEGQRLKSDRSLIFKKLNELNTIHRVIMTGTPLNNKIRELFNLMNFLDPDEWKDLEQLEKEHEELDEELVKQLHNRLRPYFLRRTKKEVLKLPPKNEVIVPVSMTPLQKEIYRGILRGNLEILKSLQASNAKAAHVPKTNMNNMLMQLRKCLQHPYLVSEDIEPRDLPLQVAHDKLIEASTKLRFLKMLLPKLKARGHRVLLFSQFMIALDIIEDFLDGEGIRHLRLDGNTPSAQRQKGMDEFNRPGSDIFIYLLTTRAGGVGINLWSADTVIIFDPDFNPQQDLQAISRSHRFGQQKTVLVFKLMVKDSAEERMMQIAKKKLVLDHLIVQRMDDDDEVGDNVQSVLMHGAQALFTDEAEETSRDITYTDTDVNNLIEKTEKESEQQEEVKEGGFSFSFAKVWAAEKSSLDELEGEEDVPEQVDSWAATLKKIEEEAAKARAQALEEGGRGKRRRAAAPPIQKLQLGGSPPPEKESNKGKGKRRIPANAEESDDYKAPEESGSDSDSSEGYQDPQEVVNILQNGRARSSSVPMVGARRSDERCGMCGGRHVGKCILTESSDNLAEYRKILLTHEGDEIWEERREAIQRIEEVLIERGDIAKIAGQPLHLIGGPGVAATTGALTGDVPRKPGRPLKKPKANGTPSVAVAPVMAATSSGVGPNARGYNNTPGNAAGRPSARAVAGPTANRIANVATVGRSPIDKTDGAAMVDEGKAAANRNTPCLICHEKPVHVPKQCPAAQEGPSRIAEAIQRLDGRSDAQAIRTVEGLRRMLIQMKKAELARAQDTDAMQIG